MTTEQNIISFKNRYGDTKQWTTDSIDRIIKEAVEAKVGIGYVLNRAIEKSLSSEIIAKILSSVKKYPSAENEIKSAMSSFFQEKSCNEILIDSIDPKFQPFILSSTIQRNKSVDKDEDKVAVAQGAIKAAAFNSDCIDEYGTLIQENLLKLDIDDIVRAAISSSKVMKFILSTIVPMIINKESFAFTVMQVLCADPTASPARLVAEDLKNKYKINCLL